MAGLVEVHQFHSGTARGDAITQQLLDLRRRIRSLGYKSEIFAEHIPRELAEEIHGIDRYAGTADDVLLVHHSIGHTAFDRLMRIPSKIVTVFHSITPAHFFEDVGLQNFIHLGFDQLRSLAARSVCGIADSNHNRREMLDAGFQSVRVLPVRTEFKEARASGVGRPEGASDWLFVGRVVPNKRQIELVRAFAFYQRAFNPHTQLRLIGDASMSAYVSAVRAEAHRCGVADRVSILGKVPEAVLWESYGRSGHFVCLSDHEGFGVPLLEAMASGLPVLARAAAAVPETMGGAGVLLLDDELWTAAGVAAALDRDGDLKSRLVSDQMRRIAQIEEFDVDAVLSGAIDECLGTRRRPTVQVQGPFETSYSLAMLNRELAEAMARSNQFAVSLYATEGPGDYQPSTEDLVEHPIASGLFERRLTTPFPDVVVRQMYPPRVNDSPGGLTFQYFGWEESRIPSAVAEDFNRHLDGIGVMSHYVARVLRDSGVVVPIEAVGVGVIQPDPKATIEAPELAEIRTCRFLHISSAFPRKGIDILLDAYFRTFTGDDDVSLVLKTFPNVHSDVAAQLELIQKCTPNPPHVAWIDRDLSSGELAALYKESSCLVHTPRGEGFGLTVAEAMLARLPVISVAATGLADFVNDSTAATISFTIEPANSHLTVPGSTWVVPSASELITEMRAVYQGEAAPLRAQRVENAFELIATTFNWDEVAARWERFIQEIITHRSVVHLDVISTWNSRCGIAEYSKNLIAGFGRHVKVNVFADAGAEIVDHMAEADVRRVWVNGLDHVEHELFPVIGQSRGGVLHVQHNFGFLNNADLARLLRVESLRRPVVVTLHRTADLQLADRAVSLRSIKESLGLAAALIVHQEADVITLKEFGITDNVVKIPIGCGRPLTLDRSASRTHLNLGSEPFIVGAFGFLLPHKGVLTLIRAIAQLRRLGHDVHLVAACALHPDPSSAEYAEECRREIALLGIETSVHLETAFLAEQDTIKLLAAADVMVLPYGPTLESSSAALRSILPLCVPIVTSDLPIFADASEVLMTVPAPMESADLCEKLVWLMEHPTERDVMGNRIAAFCEAHSWVSIAHRTANLYRTLVSEFHGHGLIANSTIEAQ
jgi:glycosyltransferase involved in cell wall biosynthesis